SLGLGKGAIDLMEVFEDSRPLMLGNAWPRISHADCEVAVNRSGSHAHLAGVGELDSVADQVEKHLGQALLISEANWKRLVYGSRKRELLVLGKRLRGRAHRLDHTLNRVFAHVEGELPGFDLGDIKDCIYQAQQVLAVGSDAGEGIERFRSLWLV